MIKILFISLFLNSGNVKPIAELEIVKCPQGDERMEITSKFGFTSSSCGFLFMVKYYKCKVDGCTRLGKKIQDKIVYIKGYCDMHYNRMNRTGTTEKIKPNKCSINGCIERGVKSKFGVYFPKGYCAVHYYRLIKYGNTNINCLSFSPKKCKVIGCLNEGRIKTTGNISFSLGYCTIHYNSFKIYGDPLFAKRKKILSTEEKEVVNIYNGIMQRCYNSTAKCYKYYGARGIKVCKRWLGDKGLKNFTKDMGKRPSKKHSIDRIKNNKGYYPNNCRWATPHQQTANMRSNNKIVGVSFYKTTNRWLASFTINGKVMNLGRYKKYEDAVTARKEAELKYLGYNL